MNIKFFIAAALAACTFSSCSDMFDTKSDRLVYDPALDNKVDSMFYTLGALKGVQQAIDQYVLTNEMRGDLVSPTSKASDDLHNLAAFRTSATTRYDSAYVYYRIINNCNYYIAHRDTTLITSGRYVTKNEYVEAFAIRAWAYLQLAKTYGDVPFYTNPLTDIASIEAVEQMPRKNMREISDLLLADMLKYSGTPVPNSTKDIDAGTTNAGNSKTVIYSKMMIPIDVIIGDLYLETNRYAEAAKYYFTYLSNTRTAADNYTNSYSNYPDYSALPKELRTSNSTHTSVTGSSISNYSWSQIFSTSSPRDIVTYVPMATNKLRGTTTALPGLFGYNYYNTADDETYNEDVSLEPSKAYTDLCDNQDYYFATGTGENSGTWEYYSAPLGDMRRYVINTTVRHGNDPSFNVMSKYNGANIPLYRGSMIYLRLAEAVNRMGHPDVAFAILKDGLSETRLENSLYLTEEGRKFLTTELPFLSDIYTTRFAGNTGIHGHGSGYTTGSKALYQFDTEVGKKLDALRNNANLNITLGEDAKADTINAVEDLICDEMALELAFEGSRFGDLCRIARHKNESNPYAPGVFGSKWLADKLAFKSPEVDLTDPNNWYMPFR